MRDRLVLLVLLSTASCGGARPMTETPVKAAPSAPSGPTFADDVAFLEKHGPLIVLADPRGGRVAVSAQYQGRVMTSAVAPAGASLGFVHRAFIEAGKTKTAFDNYGGEDRFWLGPEAGQFGLYFPPGKPFEFDHWQTPHELQEGAWTVQKSTPTSVTVTKSMTVTNWMGTRFDVAVERTISLVAPDDVRKHLRLEQTPELPTIAYETRNKISNVGTERWAKETGLVSIWILAMFAPAADARAIIPLKPRPPGDERPAVNDLYFGKVPRDRLSVREGDGYLVMSCDGKHRSKIGVRPSRVGNVIGSFSERARLLTLVAYEPPTDPTTARYVNSMWEKQTAPYDGDVVNAYNDGPPAPGKPPLGGFYELETSSPGAELAPGQSLVHVHRTFHFVGETPELDPIARRTLGVGLQEATR